jgi:hypothetical protein
MSCHIAKLLSNCFVNTIRKAISIFDQSSPPPPIIRLVADSCEAGPCLCKFETMMAGDQYVWHVWPAIKSRLNSQYINIHPLPISRPAANMIGIQQSIQMPVSSNLECMSCLTLPRLSHFHGISRLLPWQRVRRYGTSLTDRIRNPVMWFSRGMEHLNTSRETGAETKQKQCSKRYQFLETFNLRCNF